MPVDTSHPAGTRSFALDRISCRSAVKSVIVFVLTVATGRALLPDTARGWASVTRCG
jgi:hypothetical protein